MMELYHESCLGCSKLVTNNYSTSFSLGIRMFNKRFRDPIYAIYGFVRFADEIVDTFHKFEKAQLIKQFREDTFRSIDEKISLNPILHSFQRVVNHYAIDYELIDGFLISMEMDLNKKTFNREEYEKYIYGSAEVIGLMCLKIFLEGDQTEYERLKYPAQQLGSAFQKVNFLRDIQSDFEERGRVYFPQVEYSDFSNEQKLLIESEIQSEFDEALVGLKQLPKGSRLGVFVAYLYYSRLLKRIKKFSAKEVLKQRIRISDLNKFLLLIYSAFRYRIRAI